MNASKPRRRRRWVRRVLVLLVVALLVVFLSPLLLGLPFVRDRVAAGASEALGRPVRIASASAFWWKGVTLEGVTVESPPGFAEPLATVRRVHAKVDLPALLSGRVVARLEVDSPWITFQEDANGRWNTEGLFPADAGEAREAPADASAGDATALTFVLRDGLVRAARAGAPPQEIRALEAHVETTSASGLEARVRALLAGAGTDGGDVGLEVDARLPAAPGETGPVRVRLPNLDLARVALVARGATGVENLEGRLDVDVDARASRDGALEGRVAATLLDLAFLVPEAGRFAADRLALVHDPQASGDAAGAHTIAIEGRGIALPAPNDARAIPPTDVLGRVRLLHEAERTTVEVPALSGFGFEVTARAVLAGGALEEATATLGGDLARARALLAPLLDLAPKEALAGRVRLEAAWTPETGGDRLRADLGVEGLGWRDAEGRVVLADERVALRADLLAGRGEVRADLAGIALVLEGGATDDALDAVLRLEGDAAKLAPRLRRWLGPDYDDLQGRGPLEGTVALRGPVSEGLARLLAEGRIALGSWSSGGLSLEGPTLGLSRANATQPFAIRLESGVNGGTLALDLGVRPDPDAMPFTLDLVLAGVDTAPLLVDRGVGRALTLLFPTLLPSDAETRVLSGRLDAKVALSADDLGGERMAPSLSGEGTVSMKDGAIGQSTLFQVVGGGGMGQVGQALARVVPDVGRGLADLSRALAFTSVESSFRIESEVVHIDRGLLDGEKVRVGFTGRAAFDERVHLKVPVMVKGKAAEQLNRILGTPALPLLVTGTLSEPKVAPEIDKEKLARGALEGLIPGGGGEKPLDRLRDLLR